MPRLAVTKYVAATYKAPVTELPNPLQIADKNSQLGQDADAPVRPCLCPQHKNYLYTYITAPCFIRALWV